MRKLLECSMIFISMKYSGPPQCAKVAGQPQSHTQVAPLHDHTQDWRPSRGKDDNVFANYCCSSEGFLLLWWLLNVT